MLHLFAKDKAVSRSAYPKSFRLFNLNQESLKQELFTIVGSNASRLSTVISLPNADRQLEQFEVFKAPISNPPSARFCPDEGHFQEKDHKPVCHAQNELFASRHSDHGFQD